MAHASHADKEGVQATGADQVAQRKKWVLADGSPSADGELTYL